MILSGLVILCLIYHSGKKEEMIPLYQSEVLWNTKEELALLSGIENRIRRAEQGDVETIPVYSTASGYEAICPEMQAGVLETEQETVNVDKKTVFLSFDDGPSRQTEKILDILEQYGIKATFFVVSKDLTQSGTEALQRAVKEGHVIGMHSDSHDYKKIYASVESLMKDYEIVYRMIRETTGITPQLYRFPGGSYNSVGRQCIMKAIPEMERRGFVYFDWNVTAEDAVGNPTASSIRKNVFRNLERIDQPVILMHDGSCNSLTVEVLPEIIAELQRRGYVFDTIDHREQCYFNW